MAFKKPTAKKFPKAPKAGASIEALKRHADKCKEIEKENLKKLGDYEKAKAERDKLKKAAKKSKDNVRAKSASV